MKLDKPFSSAAHLLGAIGTDPVGFRIERSKDHVVRREPATVRTPSFLLQARGQSNPMPDGSVATMQISRAIYARDCLLRRANPKHPEKIDRFILGVIAVAIEEGKAKNQGEIPSLFVRKEGLAAHLEVPEHFVAQAFERLNKLGLVGPERNTGAHDTNRGGMMGGSAKGWSGSTRDVNAEKVLAYLQHAPVDNLPLKKRATP